MNVAAVMNELATRLATISGLRTFGYLPQSVAPPAAIVSFPEVYTYDTTHGRGVDSMTVPIYVLVGNVHEPSARDQLAAYMDGSGARSVKAVLKGGTYTAFSTHRVRDAAVDVYRIGSVEVLGCQFNVDITGPGD